MYVSHVNVAFVSLRDFSSNFLLSYHESICRKLSVKGLEVVYVCICVVLCVFEGEM